MEFHQSRMTALACGSAIYFRLLACDDGGWHIVLFHYIKGDQLWRQYKPGQYGVAVAECERLNRVLDKEKRGAAR